MRIKTIKEIAIIIVDWNGVEVTRNCLNSLKKLNPSSDFTVEIILVDNASTIPVKEQLSTDFPFIHYFRNENNLGFTGGNNTGIRYALERKSDYFLLLNNDTTVEPDFLQQLFDFMEANPETGAVQPKIYFEHEKTLLWNGSNGFMDVFGHTHVRGYRKKTAQKYEKVREQKWLTACAMMFNLSLLKDSELVLMNEHYFTNYEDVEQSFRIRRAGFKLYYVPQSVVYHVAGYSTNTRKKTKEGFTHPFMVYMNTRNRLLVIREYSPWYFYPTIFLFHFTYYSLLLCYFLIRNRRQKFKKVLEAIRDGLLKDYQFNYLNK
jgi:GT2 family glycosyltransferase